MPFDWMSFFVGLLAAAVYAGFTLTAGGESYAVTSVAGPLVVGLVGTVAVAVRRKTGATA